MSFSKRTILSFALVTALLLAVPAARADKKAYAFDKSHSEINFVAEALFLSAHGFFGAFDGKIEIDPDNLENSAVTITIETASINTRNERRDTHLRSADFFDATNNPQITFVSKKVTRVDAQNLLLDGDITIRGVTKPLQIPVRIVFMREGGARFKGEFKISRKEFNVSYNSTMNPIEDIVAVQFDFNLRDQQMMEEMRRRREQQRPQQPSQPPAKPPVS